MILGLGVDIAELDRIARAYARFGPRFAEKILGPAELAHMPARPEAYLASRFAAKEAAVKALGTGFRQGITLQDIEVRSDALGKPLLVLHNAAQQRLLDLGGVHIHLSLSHSRDNAVAVVIVEGEAG